MILCTAWSESAMTLCVHGYALRAYGAKVVEGRHLVSGRKVPGARPGVGGGLIPSVFPAWMPCLSTSTLTYSPPWHSASGQDPLDNQKPRAKINTNLLKLFVSGICQSDGKQTNTHTDKQGPSLETQGSVSATRL